MFKYLHFEHLIFFTIISISYKRINPQKWKKIHENNFLNSKIILNRSSRTLKNIKNKYKNITSHWWKL